MSLAFEVALALAFFVGLLVGIALGGYAPRQRKHKGETTKRIDYERTKQARHK